jgi:hypothetical protein
MVDEKVEAVMVFGSLRPVSLVGRPSFRAIR